MRVFIDLEETIIESWDNPLLMNVSKLKDILSTLEVSSVDVFSAAVWNDTDKSIFVSQMKEAIERVLDVVIVDTISMGDVWFQTQWKSAKFESICEMTALIGKKRMFEDWCREKHFNEHCILIDDSFGNSFLHNSDSGGIVQVIDVNNPKY